MYVYVYVLCSFLLKEKLAKKKRKEGEGNS